MNCSTSSTKYVWGYLENWNYHGLWTKCYHSPPHLRIPFLVYSAKCYHKYYIIDVCNLDALQTAEFLFTSKGEAIETTDGWGYIFCSKYSRKLQRGFSSFTWNSCDDSKAIYFILASLAYFLERIGIWWNNNLWFFPLNLIENNKLSLTSAPITITYTHMYYVYIFSWLFCSEAYLFPA